MQRADHSPSTILTAVFMAAERNWNIRIPGFASDEIRSLRKPNIPTSHQQKTNAINTAKAQAALGIVPAGQNTNPPATSAAGNSQSVKKE
ncbi:hypothetical protein K493DRAFT_44888 [Basidiobolus meristosporus CBS 931.73]|uniref:Uncharacterized protein n=1 Tax=Basidiobolus meristosporus CBS 931.73 TaxID=1314790 RepID=A0A1Y1Y2N4_9FUNG|nr:hypothetical protein K493DRAFT_44888 [Basidiobolus meristosporus CBS 931.73]|eukprot:ORX92260.1 hypothetical protein K493DRAFT_44888 [Basidiobolus meristosporus CBS 931.73]